MADRHSSDEDEDSGGVFQFLVGDLVEDAAQPQLGKGVVTVPPPASNYEEYGYHMQLKPFGSAEVSWFKQEYQRGSHKYVDPLSLLLLDRPLKLRDKVIRWADKDARKGKVVSVTKTVDLELDDGQVLKNIDSKTLTRVQPFLCGDYVVLGNWLGVVQSVDAVEVTIELPDSGEKCVISNEVFRYLVAEQPQSIYSHTPYAYRQPKFYPGQKVKCRASKIMKDMPWLKTKEFESVQIQAIVVDVSVTAVRVQWLASRILRDRHSPDYCLRGPELKSLQILTDMHRLVYDLHRPTSPWLELGSKWLVGSEPDMMQLETTTEQTCGSEPSASDALVSLESSSSRTSVKAGTVISTKTIVDVLWQDGTLSRGVDAGDLTNASCAVYNHGDIAQDIWPREYVCEKRMDEQAIDPEEDFDEECETEPICAEHEKGPGPRMAFVHSLDMKEKIAMVSWFAAAANPTGRWLPEEAASFYELDQRSSDMQVDFDYGCIVIRPTPASQAEKTSASSLRKRKISEESAAGKQKKSKKDLLDEVHSEMHVKADESAGSWVGVIIGYQAGGCLEVAWGDCSVSTVKHTEVETFRQHQFYPGYNYTETINEEEDEEPESEEEEYFLVEEYDHEQDVETIPEYLKLFDTLKDINMEEETHSYFQYCFRDSDAKWVKRVDKELNILKKGLPNSIYVRAYEGRKDILRAVIVGKPGTPYHDGIFTVDIQLPVGFPLSPPRYVLLDSTQELVQAVNVFIQRWDNRKSTLLQFLQFIQDSALSDPKDTTKESGHNQGKVKVIEQAQANRLKLEKSFMHNCNCILKVLKKPPQHFEKLVGHHFETQGPRFLGACQAYLKGAPIGEPDKMQGPSDLTSTKGFQLMLKKVIPRIQTELGAAALGESLDAVGL